MEHTPENEERQGLRERQKKARSEAILQAAFDLIVEQGYDALTMEGLATRVGISRQTLYHHFASREDIVLKAILTLMEQGMEAIQSFDMSLAPVERLRRVVRWMLESRFQPATAAFVKVRHSLMTIKTHPEYQQAFERRTAALTQIVSAAQEAGEIRADLPSALIVQMLLGLISTASYEGLIVSEQVTLAKVTDAILDVFFTGIRPQGALCPQQLS
jgi:AcrR family transcriptional regulator